MIKIMFDEAMFRKLWEDYGNVKYTNVVFQ